MNINTAPAQTFGEHCVASFTAACEMGQTTADANDCPVAILTRDGWYAVCEEPPDDMDSAPLDHGWAIVALIEPAGVVL